MKLSTKCRYGARAILEIAKRVGGGPVTRRTISEQQAISGSYLDNILTDLRHAELVKAVRGKHGGYLLSRDPAEITLLEVVEALQGPIAPVDCLVDPGLCARSADCITRRAWAQLQLAERRALGAINLAEMLRDGHTQGSHAYTI